MLSHIYEISVLVIRTLLCIRLVKNPQIVHFIWCIVSMIVKPFKVTAPVISDLCFWKSNEANIAVNICVDTWYE